ncbi:dUTP diphosphatase [archaeon]|nr:dUTP diphosphatase [archaeon]MBT4241304.1 dUTP diphosphatase [archaeon]MBT4418126.1 dUTP diphosphatase [archaeon]
MNVKIKKLHPDAKVPLVGSEHAAGFDFYSVEDVILYPGETKAVSTGIAIQIPEGKACFIWDRSGMGFKGVHRFAGLIDSDYRGEFKIVLHNSNDYRFEIKKGDRIVQGVIQDYYQPKFEVVDDLENTNRGEGRFGSTGV